MSQNKDKREEKKNGIMGTLFYLFMIIVAYVAAILACFLPAAVVSKCFRMYHNKIRSYEHKPTTYMHLAAIAIQLVMWGTGGYMFYKIVGGGVGLSAQMIFTNLISKEIWLVFYKSIFYGVMPLLGLYLAAVGSFFRDMNNNETILVNTKYSLLRILAHPFIFIYMGLRAKKISWFCAGVFYAIPLYVLIYLDRHGFNGTELYSITKHSYFIMWAVSLVHMKIMIAEYKARIQSKDVVYVVNEFGNNEREAKHAA